jgi:hypothetical protein
MSAVEVTFVRDARRLARLGPEVHRVDFVWRDALIPLVRAESVDASGNAPSYQLALGGVPEVRAGALGRTAAGAGAELHTLRCDDASGELITGLGFFLDEDAHFKGLAIQCRAFELRNVSPYAESPIQRYRMQASGPARWVTTPGYAVEHLPLGSADTHKTVDPWTGRRVLNRVLFGSSSTNVRTYAGTVPLAGGVRAVVGSRASGPVPSVESYRFDWVQVGHADLLSGFDVRP